jgi:hypothetical protein
MEAKQRVQHRQSSVVTPIASWLPFAREAAPFMDDGFGRVGFRGESRVAACAATMASDSRRRPGRRWVCAPDPMPRSGKEIRSPKIGTITLDCDSRKRDSRSAEIRERLPGGEVRGLFSFAG